MGKYINLELLESIASAESVSVSSRSNSWRVRTDFSPLWILDIQDVFVCAGHRSSERANFESRVLYLVHNFL